MKRSGVVGLRHQVDDEAVGLLQRDGEGLVVLLGDVLDAQHHVLAAAVARRPAPDRGDDVVRGDGRAVRELQAVAQLEGVGELVVRDAVFRHHLRLRLHVLVEREQRVVDHRAVVGGDVRRRPDRVEGAQIPLHHGANRLAGGGLRAQHRRRLGQRGGGRRGLQERAAGSFHGVLSVAWRANASRGHWRD